MLAELYGVPERFANSVERWDIRMLGRFWDKVDKTGQCWTWTGSRTPPGYGHLRINGVQTYSHRVSYQLAHGAIPPGLWVCHRCDNPPCVRPDHLFLGTRLDNIEDRNQKGRTHHGPMRDSLPYGWNRKKLHAGQVREIRELLERSVPVPSIARQFGVKPKAISDIREQRSWRGVA